MSAEILSIKTKAQFNRAVKRAVELLRAGQLVALPTETVYGLAANAFDPEAVAKIYVAKGRPCGNPIIVHVAGIELARQCLSKWTDDAEKLAEAFWPGPLTIVLPRSKKIPDVVTAGGKTVGVRWPKHPFMEAVIRECECPLAAPSANVSNELSPTTAAHVHKSLGAKVPLIVDGGASRVGIESTVVDLSGKMPRVLRPGMISVEQLQEILGAKVFSTKEQGGVLRSPGQLPKHYSPRAKLLILKSVDDEALRLAISKLKANPKKVYVIVHSTPGKIASIYNAEKTSRNPSTYARTLYAKLHRCDDAGAELIIVEAPPAGDKWRGVADRLRRASQS